MQSQSQHTLVLLLAAKKKQSSVRNTLEEFVGTSVERAISEGGRYDTVFQCIMIASSEENGLIPDVQSNLAIQSFLNF